MMMDGRTHPKPGLLTSLPHGLSWSNPAFRLPLSGSEMLGKHLCSVRRGGDTWTFVNQFLDGWTKGPGLLGSLMPEL